MRRRGSARGSKTTRATTVARVIGETAVGCFGEGLDTRKRLLRARRCGWVAHGTLWSLAVMTRQGNNMGSMAQQRYGTSPATRRGTPGRARRGNPNSADDGDRGSLAATELVKNSNGGARVQLAISAKRQRNRAWGFRELAAKAKAMDLTLTSRA